MPHPHLPGTSGDDRNATANWFRFLDRVRASSPEASEGIVFPSENEKLAAALHRQNFGRDGRIRTGVILFASPYTHWYRVQLDDARGDMPCCALTDGGLFPFGTKTTSPYPPRTPVLVYHVDSIPYGIILGAVPPIMTDGALGMSDWISQGSNGGFRRERYYRQFPDLFYRNGGQRDFSNGRPVDATALGEWGRIADLGHGLLIDPFMSFFRLDEATGLWLFYMDRLLRLAAHNFDFRSATSERIIRDDEGESFDFEGFAVYPWEAIGLFSPGGTSYREHEDSDVHYNRPVGKLEPVEDDVDAFYRLQEHRGYLGQLYSRRVALPPPDVDVNRRSNTTLPIGVFQEHLGMDGSWAVASAHSIALVKRARIQIPHRLRDAEDPTGDDLAAETGYKPSSYYGEGEEHRISDTLTSVEDNLPHLQTAAGLQEAMAHLFTWKADHAFHYHREDFAETKQSDELESVQQPINFASLGTDQWLSRPEAKELTVDHRHEATYYETSSGVFLLPDGGLVLRDGYGGEIRMSGGSISISAPGDVWLQPGRNVIAYGGRDIVLRARNSVDVTTSEGDVRLKAEKHAEIMAGNGGVGRLMLECRAATGVHDVVGKAGEDVVQSGLILKSQSELLAWAGKIYLRTGGGDLPAGSITLDAGQGQANVQVVSSAVDFHVNSQIVMAFPSGESKSAVYAFTQGAALLPGSLQTDRGLIIGSGGAQISGSVSIINGGVATDRHRDGRVSYHTPANQSWVTTDVNVQNLREAQQIYQESTAERYGLTIQQAYYGEQQPGNDTVIANSQFSPRTEEQLRTTDFQLPATYWQTLAGAYGYTSGWTEPVIKYQGQDVLPHPGMSNWKEKDTFLKPQFKLHDVKTGVDEPPGDDYETAELESWDKSPPENNYIVIA